MKYNIPQTNYTVGRGTYKPEAIVIHIMQGSLSGTGYWFSGENNKANPPIQSSSHIGIGKNGQVDEYVSTDDTAYHAGRINAPVWPGMKKTLWGTYVNPNGYTIGIECEGMRGDTWTEEQMVSICAKVKEYCAKYNIPVTRATIISHNEITADKEDMRAWCDEIIRRLYVAPVVPATQSKDQIKAQIIDLLKQL